MITSVSCFMSYFILNLREKNEGRNRRGLHTFISRPIHMGVTQFWNLLISINQIEGREGGRGGEAGRGDHLEGNQRPGKIFYKLKQYYLMLSHTTHSYHPNSSVVHSAIQYLFSWYLTYHFGCFKNKDMNLALNCY